MGAGRTGFRTIWEFLNKDLRLYARIEYNPQSAVYIVYKQERGKRVGREEYVTRQEAEDAGRAWAFDQSTGG